MNGSIMMAMDNQQKHSRPSGPQSFKEYLGLNKARIYNLQQRKKPAELVRKDLISAMKMADHENLNRDHYLRILDPWREEWEKGVQVPVNAEALPQANIKLLEDDSGAKAHPSSSSITPAKSSVVHVNRELSREHSFKLPKNLIRHENVSEPPTTSYELDLQDICWLETLSASELSVQIPDSLLEDVVNELEQQCARNIKEQQMGIEYDDHIVCDVCQCPDAEDENEMVFCENCNICVHQACYGIPEIPLGDWFCNSCRDMGSKKNAICVLCPNVGGALKPTTNSKWCHVSCAYWVPEVKFLNLSILEPIEIKSIPNWRWNMVCSLCNIKKGTPILCDVKNCRTAYHVSCAFKQKLKLKIVLNDDKTDVMLKSYCQRHTAEQPTSNDDNCPKEVDFISRTVNDTETSPRKNINPQYEFWKYVEINKVYQEISKKYLSDGETSDNVVKDCTITPKVLQQLIDLIHNYWKLKRISNYGNSLIKPTFAQKFEEEMHIQHTKLIEFRYHLERLRTLTYMLCRRERLKESWFSTQKEIFENSCKLFIGIDSTSKPEDVPQSTNIQPHVSNEELFMQILKHDNIYLTPNDEQPSSDQANPSGRSLASTTVPFDEMSTYESTQSIASSSQDGFSTRKQGETSSHKNMTNHILRQLKRLSRAAGIQTSKAKPNPYAKVYLNSASKRKGTSETVNTDELQLIDSPLQSGNSSRQRSSEVVSARTETSTTSKLKSPSRTTTKNHESGKSEAVLRAKRRLDLSAAEGSSPFGPSNDSIEQRPTKRKHAKWQIAVADEGKRVYNFRKTISMDDSSGEETAATKVVVVSKSHQKENGLCVNQRAKSPCRISQRELSKLGLSFTENGNLADHQLYGNGDLYPFNVDYERKSLRSTSNSENLKASTANCLSAEIKNRFRQYNHFNSSRRINSS